MFFRDKLSNILRSSQGGGGGTAGAGAATSAPAPAATSAPAPAGASAPAPTSNGSNASSNAQGETEPNKIHTYKPSADESRNYNKMNGELDAEIDKQRKRKKNALIFFGIGIVCTVMLGVGLFTPYGINGFTAMESLQGAKGGALGLQSAELAFAFSAVGFAIPIAMTAISLIAGLVSNNKINKFKKERAVNYQLLSGVSSLEKNISKDRGLQHEAAVLMVENRGQSWQNRVTAARKTATNIERVRD